MYLYSDVTIYNMKMFNWYIILNYTCTILTNLPVKSFLISLNYVAVVPLQLRIGYSAWLECVNRGHFHLKDLTLRCYLLICPYLFCSRGFYHELIIKFPSLVFAFHSVGSFCLLYIYCCLWFLIRLMSCRQKMISSLTHCCFHVQ